MIILLAQEALGLQIGDHGVLRLLAREARVGPGGLGELAVGADGLDRGKLVALAELEIVLVVRGRDFQAAGAEFKVNV